MKLRINLQEPQNNSCQQDHGAGAFDLSDTIVDAGYLKQLALHISSYEHLWII